MGIIKKVLRLLGVVFDIRDTADLIRWLFASTGCAAVLVAAMNAVITNIPTLSLILFGVGFFLLLLAFLPRIFRLFSNLIGGKNHTEFYQSRGSAPQVIRDIEKAGEVWVAWHTATVQGTSGQLKWQGLGNRVSRLILLDPRGRYIAIHAPMMPNISKEKLQSDIETAKKRFTDEGVREIVYFDGLMLSMVICNPNDSKNGWIRVEPWSPFLETGNRPVFYIHAEKHPSAFKSLRDAYDMVWRGIPKSK